MDNVTVLDDDALVRARMDRRKWLAIATKKFTDYETKIKAEDAVLEAEMLRRLTERKAKNVRTDSGTFFKEEVLHASCNDWGALYRWTAENDAFEILHKRVSEKFVKTYLEKHEGHLPPGVSTRREYVVRVRKPAGN